LCDICRRGNLFESDGNNHRVDFKTGKSTLIIFLGK
jgi:hypothetical protein